MFKSRDFLVRGFNLGSGRLPLVDYRAGQVLTGVDKCWRHWHWQDNIIHCHWIMQHPDRCFSDACLVTRRCRLIAVSPPPPSSTLLHPSPPCPTPSYTHTAPVGADHYFTSAFRVDKWWCTPCPTHPSGRGIKCGFFVLLRQYSHCKLFMMKMKNVLIAAHVRYGRIPARSLCKVNACMHMIQSRHHKRVWTE